MGLNAIALLLIVISSAGLGLLVILSNYKNPANKVFACFIGSVLLWIVSLYLSNFYGPFAMLFTRLTFLGAILVGLSLEYFSFYFPDARRSIAWWLHLLVLLPTAAITAIVLFSDKVIAGVTIISNGTGVAQGNWYYAWPVYFFSILIFAFANLEIKLKSAKNKERNQLRVVFLGLTLSLAFAVTTNLVFPLVFKNDSLSNVGPYGTIIFIAFTSYAIVRHEFLHIRVIATEALVVAINLALVFNFLYSPSLSRSLVNAGILVFSLLAGYLLVKSVVKEVRQREHLQEMTAELTKAVTHLQILDKMKSEFVSLASHELLTPISAIEGYLSMILEEKLVQVKDPTAHLYLERIYRSAKRLARLIADMLNISRIEEGRLLVEKQDVDLSQLIEQVIDEIKFKAEERKQRIVFKRGNWQTYGDPDKLKEVIVNLVGNSIKYSEGPGVISIQVNRLPTALARNMWSRGESKTQAKPSKGQEAIDSAVDPSYRDLVGKEQLVISIKDQGVGIPKEELPKLFQKFHRVGAGSSEVQGNGLGLYISRALVELHHGHIWADSEGPGRGSTFFLTLPELAAKAQIVEMEKDVNQDKEQLKPLARPMNSELEDI